MHGNRLIVSRKVQDFFVGGYYFAMHEQNFLLSGG